MFNCGWIWVDMSMPHGSSMVNWNPRYYWNKAAKWWTQLGLCRAMCLGSFKDVVVWPYLRRHVVTRHVIQELTDFQMVVQAPLPTSTRPAVVNLVQLDIIFSRSAFHESMVRWCQSMWFCEWKSTLKLAFCIILPFGSRSLYISFWTPSFWAKLQILADGWQLLPGNCSRPRQHMQLGRDAWWTGSEVRLVSLQLIFQDAKSLCQLGGWGIRPARHPVTLIEVASLPQFGVFCKVQFLQLQDIISITANFWVSFFGLWIYSY